MYMKTILVPTDFSATATNAAKYAVQLADQIKASKIVFYNAFQAPVSVDPTLPVVQMVSIDDLRKTSEEALKKFATENGPAGLDVEIVSEYHTLNTGIEEVIQKVQADLVVMGITGGGELEQIFIGSNAVHVAKNSSVPVIIVPNGAQYVKINEVMLMTDLKNVADTIPEGKLKKFFQTIYPRMFVLHVDPEDTRETAEAQYETLLLDSMFSSFHPEYIYSSREDFTDAMNEFAENRSVDMIITIPKKRSWFDSLIKPNHTKMLAFHSKVPLMVVNN